MEEGKQPRGYWVDDEQYAKLSDEDKERHDANPWNMPADQPLAGTMTQMTMLGGEDEEPEEEEAPPGKTPTKEEEPVEKSQRESKFLKITI